MQTRISDLKSQKRSVPALIVFPTGSRNDFDFKFLIRNLFGGGGKRTVRGFLLIESAFSLFMGCTNPEPPRRARKKGTGTPQNHCEYMS